MKRLVRILVVVLILVVAGLVGLHFYLSSHAVASQIAARLQGLYGAPVEVGSAGVGLVGRSSLGGLKLYEAGGESAPRAWLTADTLSTDLSAWDVLTGTTIPNDVTITGATVRLRYDAHGHLLTRFPKAGKGQVKKFPVVRLERSTVILERVGQKRGLEISGINVDLAPRGDRLAVSGAAADRAWGEWDVTGEIAPADFATRVTLRTARPVHVSLDMLKEIPFVAPSVWETVQVEGDTPGELTFRYEPGKGASYVMELAPRDTHVKVPLIRLDAHKTRGKLTVDNQVLRLRDVRGEDFGGTIATNADLDFSGPDSVLDFYQVKARDLDIARMPENLRYPIRGRLTGEAHMKVVIPAQGRVRTTGGGQGKITHTNLGAPVEVELRSTGEGFHLGDTGQARRAPDRTSPAPAARPQASPTMAAAPPKPARAGVEDNLLPVQLVRLYHAGLVTLAEGLIPGDPTRAPAAAAGGGDAANPPAAANPQPAQPAPAPGQPRYWEATLKMEDVDAATFVKGVGLKLPFPVTGRFSFQVHAAIPLSNMKDLRAYRASGTVTAPHLELEDLHLRRVRSRVTLRDGLLRLDELYARVPPENGAATRRGADSTVQGSATMALAPVGDLTADVSLKNIPLSQVAGLVPALKEKPAGMVDGSVKARVPVKQLKDPAAWDGSGRLTSPSIRAVGWTLRDLETDVRVRKGTLTLRKAQVRVAGTTVSGSGHLKLTGADPYHARVHMPGWDLAALDRLAPGFRPPVSLAGTLQTTVDVDGTLEPLAVRSSGRATVKGLKVQGIALSSVKFRWESTADRLIVSDIKSSLYDGDLSGSATIPLQPSAAGKVNLRFEHIDVGDLGKAIPKNPLRLAGKADGSVKGTIAPAGKNGRRADLDLDLSAPVLFVQGVPARRVQGSLRYDNGMVDYNLLGQALGGRFNLKGKVAAGPEGGGKPQKESRRYPTTFPKDRAASGRALAARLEVFLQEADEPVTGGGRLQLQGIQLRQLWEGLGVQNALGALRGSADLDVTYRNVGPERALVGSGRLVLRRLRWGQNVLAGTLTSDVTVDRDVMRFRNLSGNLGAGLVTGQVSLDLARLDRSWFYLRLDGVEAARLFAPWPELARHVEGPMDAVLRSTIGAVWNGMGEADIRQGRVDGVEVTDARLPLTWALAPGYGRGEVTFQDASAEVALGRVAGRMRLTVGAASSLDGQLRFQNVDIRTLLHELGTGTQYGSGKIGGRFDFSSPDFASLADLTGTLDATLSQVQPSQAPVLRQVIPIVRGSGATATTFNSGKLRGTLSRGVFRIQQFNLSSRVLQLVVQGTVTLAGRLDLDVTAVPGALASNSVAQQLLRQIPLAGQTSGRVLGVAGQLLASQLIHVRVTGTFRNPNVRYQPFARGG